MTRQLILCADDFGMSPTISEAIVLLAERDRINAISCMALVPGWMEDARRLDGLTRQIAIGLHLVLTDYQALSGASALAPGGQLPRLHRLARLAKRGALPQVALRAEILAQFDRFSKATGRAPDFVDGHQHCHHLPLIRRIVVEETARLAPGAWLRDCTDRPGAMLARPFALKALRSGGFSAGFSKMATAAGLRTNEGFAGHYDFKTPSARLFERFLVRPGARHLVMCHPGRGRLAGDSIAAAREFEFQMLEKLAVRETAEAHGLKFDSRFEVAPLTTAPPGLQSAGD